MPDQPELAGLKQVASTSSASSTTANALVLSPSVLLTDMTVKRDDDGGGTFVDRLPSDGARLDDGGELEKGGVDKLSPANETDDEHTARLAREERESKYLHGFKLVTVLYVPGPSQRAGSSCALALTLLSPFPPLRSTAMRELPPSASTLYLSDSN